METVVPQKEIVDAIKASGGDAFKYCYQCGMCDTVCPWNKVRNFSMRKLVREATFGLTEIESEDIWRCTTCGKCPQVCPRGVKQIESGVALRRIATCFAASSSCRASGSRRPVTLRLTRSSFASAAWSSLLTCMLAPNAIACDSFPSATCPAGSTTAFAGRPKPLCSR